LAAGFTEEYLNPIMMRYGHYDQQKTKWMQVDAMLTYTSTVYVQVGSGQGPNIFFSYDTDLSFDVPMVPFYSPLVSPAGIG
jgi:hypothetical protein